MSLIIDFMLQRKFKNTAAILIISVFVFSSACKTKSKIVSSSGQTVDITDKVENKEVSKTIEPYKNKLDNSMSEVLNSSVEPMPKEKDVPESLLGNFVADLTLFTINQLNDSIIKSDFCLLNNGGLRTSLPQGNIIRGKVFELMPFENEIVIVTLSGHKVNELLQYVAKVGGAPVSGLKMGIKNAVPYEPLINNLPFDSLKEYRVATTDYLANGGDKMYFFESAISYYSTGKKLRDAIIEFMIEEKKNGRKIKSVTDNRIYNVQ
jgi:2',3'-cyclic-nucleotide 2'-phosphodiesterase (5'-nucleotidase family)